MRRFLRKSSVQREPLAITMTGVRMGERVLQIGVADAALTSMLAARPGLSGHSAIVASNERDAARARNVIADAGALVDVHVAALHALPLADSACDVVILHHADALLAPLDAAARSRVLRECQRVLRPGGRIIAIEPGTPAGLAALLRRTSSADPAYGAAGGTVAVVEAAGFRPARLLADREGYRFIEGLKPH